MTIDHFGDAFGPGSRAVGVEPPSGVSPVPASIPIALGRFIGPESRKMDRPYSIGDFTFATNGHIIVRVPRRPDAPEIAGAPDARSHFSKPPTGSFVALKHKLPKPTFDDCDRCDGRGTSHDCPRCECVCSACGGSGQESSDIHCSVLIGGVPFGLRYARELTKLPGIEAAVPAIPGQPLAFRFDGGDGLLMPLTSPHVNHIKRDLAQGIVTRQGGDERSEGSVERSEIEPGRPEGGAP